MSSNARNLSKLLGNSTTVPSTRLDPVVNQNISNALTLAEAPPTQGLNDVSELPLSGNDIGDQAYVASTGRFYIWTGSGWYNIALINNNPAFDSGGTPDPLYTLDSYNGSPTIIQLSASDPEEVPVQWNYVASDSAQYFATIQQDSSVFTITALPTPTIGQYDSDGGTFSITFKASDGVNLATALSEFTITFSSSVNLSDFSGMTFSGSYQPSTGDASPEGLHFKPDGTSLFTVGSVGDSVYRYDLSTPWDIKTSTYISSFSVSSQDTVPTSVFFKPDGTKMYILGDGNNLLYRYNLSTPWDITTATHDNRSGTTSNETASPLGIYIKPDGLKSYVCSGNIIYSYTNPAAWDVYLMSYDGSGTNGVLESGTVAEDINFKDDGSLLMVSNAGDLTIDLYTLSTPWDLTTLSYSRSISALDSEDLIKGSVFGNNGASVYLTGSRSDSIYQYNLTSPYSFAPLSTLSSVSVQSEDVVPTAVFFKSDGTKMYVSGTGTDSVYQYTLSTPWNVSSATYDSVSFSFAGQDTGPEGLFFKPDGTKMYMSGLASDLVYQYTLSTPWDVSSATYDSISFSVISEGANPSGMYISSNGSKLYFISIANNNVFQYTLSTPWDVSSASYDNKSLSRTATQSHGIYLSDDLSILYLCSASAIISYDLSAPGDLSTASFSNSFYLPNSISILAEDIFLGNGGNSIYWVSSTAPDSIYQWSL